MRHDVTFPLYVEVDEIYNLACPASPIHYQHDPVQTTKTSVHGAINMLGLAKRLKARSCRPRPARSTATRRCTRSRGYWGNVNPIGVRSCYDEGKRCAETLFFDYHRQHGLRIKVARIFNTYGPRMHPNDGRVVSNFIVQALKGEAITSMAKAADALLLLRRRPGRRPAAPDEFPRRIHRPGQPRQPGRALYARDRPEGARHHRLA
jgi:UDP-glucuronate decarboxylase